MSGDEELLSLVRHVLLLKNLIKYLLMVIYLSVELGVERGIL